MYINVLNRLGRVCPAIINVEAIDSGVAQTGGAQKELVNQELAQHGAVCVIPKILSTWHTLTTITGLVTRAIAARMLGGLVLVVIENRATGWGPVVIALWHRVISRSAEFQEPIRIGGIHDLLAHGCEPGKSLHEVAIDEDLGIRVDSLDSFGLLHQQLFACHGRRIGPQLLGIRPVEISNTKGGGEFGIEKSAEVAGHENRALLGIVRDVPGWQTDRLGLGKISIVAVGTDTSVCQPRKGTHHSGDQQSSLRRQDERESSAPKG